jgi:hypothetical protein
MHMWLAIYLFHDESALQSTILYSVKTCKFICQFEKFNYIKINFELKYLYMIKPFHNSCLIDNTGSLENFCFSNF